MCSTKIEWLHLKSSTNDSLEDLNKLFASNSSFYFNEGDFYVLQLDSSNEISSQKTVCKQIHYLNVYSSNRWLKFELIEELSKRTHLFSSNYKSIFYLREQSNATYFSSINDLIRDLLSQTRTQGFARINSHEIVFRNGVSKEELNRKLSDLIQDAKKKETKAPRKPTRVPTVKLAKSNRPNLLLAKLKVDDEDYTDLSEDLLSQMHKNDINAPKLALKSQFDLKAYSCDIIANKSKKLDRLALIEITKALLLTESSSSQKCCAACCDLTRNSTVYLAKYFTFEDLKCVRFNFDFGLGVFTGLEMITLPQGEIIRNDLIQRAKTSSLFLSLLILLCQNSGDRINLLVKLIDCAALLFDKLNNLYAFAYVMQSFDHAHVKRLTQTWNELKRTNEVKYNLFQTLAQKFESLTRGDYFFLEQNALIANIYPISVLLTRDHNTKTTNHHYLLEQQLIEDDYTKLIAFNEIYLALNARYFAANSSNYAFKSELFIQNESTKLFPATSTSNCFHLNKIYSYIAQTEFQQLIMWSDDYYDRNNESIESSPSSNLENDTSSYYKKRINDFNQLLKILSFKIQQEE